MLQGREDGRGRRRRAGRHRRGGEGRRDRLRLRAARLARRGPRSACAPLEFPTPMHRRRDRAEAPRRRAAAVRRPAQDDGRGSDAVGRARRAAERDGAARPGRPAPALHARADGAAVQAGGRDAAAADPLSRDDHRARPRATTATRSRPAAPASSARCTCASSRCRAARASSSSTQVKGGVDSRPVSFRPCEKGVEQVLGLGAGRGLSAAGRARHRLRRQAPSGRLEGSRVRDRRHARRSSTRSTRRGRSCSSRSSTSRSMCPSEQHRRHHRRPVVAVAARSPARARCRRARSPSRARCRCPSSTATRRDSRR